MSRLFVRVALAGVVLSMTGALTSAQQQTTRPAAPSDVPRLTFEKYTLPNGLDVIMRDRKSTV